MKKNPARNEPGQCVRGRIGRALPRVVIRTPGAASHLDMDQNPAALRSRKRDPVHVLLLSVALGVVALGPFLVYDACRPPPSWEGIRP